MIALTQSTINNADELLYQTNNLDWKIIQASIQILKGSSIFLETVLKREKNHTSQSTPQSQANLLTFVVHQSPAIIPQIVGQRFLKLCIIHHKSVIHFR